MYILWACVDGNIFLNPAPSVLCGDLSSLTMTFLGVGMIFPRTELQIFAYFLFLLQGFGIFASIHTCHSPGGDVVIQKS